MLYVNVIAQDSVHLVAPSYRGHVEYDGLPYYQWPEPAHPLQVGLSYKQTNKQTIHQTNKQTEQTNKQIVCH